jgi:hypothetical protein
MRGCHPSCDQWLANGTPGKLNLTLDSPELSQTVCQYERPSMSGASILRLSLRHLTCLP